MDAAKLFNCCTNHAEPDWTQYDGLELGGCITVREAGEEWTEGGQLAADADFFTVYGRFRGGGCEAITDINTLDDANVIAQALATRSALPLAVFC